MATGWRSVRLGRRGKWALATAIVLGGLGAGWLVLPDAGLRWGLIRTLRDFGMVDVSIADSALSLFDGHLMVREVVARAPLGSSALGVGDLALRFRWKPLFNKRLAIDHLSLTGVTIDLRRESGSDVFVLNGLPLALSGEQPPSQEHPTEAAPAKTSWGIDLAELELTDSRLQLVSGALKADIAIRHLIVTNLHSQIPDLPVAFTLDGTLNGAPITLNGTVLPFASEPTFTLSLTTKDLDPVLFQEALAEIGLKGLKGGFDAAVSAEGRLTAAGPKLTGSGQAEIRAARLAEPVTLAGERLTLDLKQAAWDGKSLDLSAELTAAGLTVTAKPISVSAATLRLDAASARWEGRKVAWQGSLSADTLAIKGGGPDITAATLRLDASPARLDGARLTWQGNLGVTSLALTGISPEIAAAALRWTGQAEANGISSARAEGRLELDSGRLTDSDYALTIAKASSEGKIESTSAQAAWPISAQVKLNAEKIAASATRGAREWGAVDKLDAAGLTITGKGGIGATRLGIDGVTALRRGGPAGYPWRVEARSLRLDRPAYDGANAVSAAGADIAGLTLRLTRTEIGLLGFSFPSSGKTHTASTSHPLGISLDRLTIGNGSKLLFEDRSLNEPVRLVARSVDLSVSRLDNAHPDRDSPFDLSAMIGDSKVAASGMLRPFTDSPGGTIDARITALELPPLSPYLAEALGVHLRTGHFDGTVRGEANNGALDGQIELTLSNLFIAAPDPNAPLARKTGMPVETMLDLLRGGDERIRLSIPVRGRLDSPDFDVSDAVAQAVAGAVSSTVMTTLKVAFPFTTLISLVTDLGEGNHLALAPLGFAAGSVTLTDEQRETLDQVATLMRSRDSLRLTLCGKAISTEGQALALQRRTEERPLLSRLERLIGTEPAASGLEPADRDALTALANRRAAVAKNYLSEQAGIAPERLFTCRGEVEESGDKGPRVDLLL
ncbi:DUF748 domain-containing protein [Magnetospirillum molischianum]|uniref:DUF748 domain-containing protein n=1 Tax=Magnetospirillum molischianum DSM 120 TaxID=1150626 RepID=H8FTD4_MAGML|nr:DUF748 domain-containing protein [Magnetospirillum molischianum]CCG41622.1 conserved hypothetical protein [Magnetospirillum molischianum DSM 120]